MESNLNEMMARFNVTKMRELQAQQPYLGLITPERTNAIMPQIFTNREQMIRGVIKMWEMIMSTPPNDAKHQEAINKLRNVQKSLGEQYRAMQQRSQQQAQAQAMANGAQQNSAAQRPLSQHVQQTQPAASATRPHQPQPAQATQQPPQQTQPSRNSTDPPPQYTQQAAAFPLFVATNLSPEAMQAFVNDTRKKLALAFWRQTQIKESLSKCIDAINQASRLGKDAPQDALMRKTELDKNMNDVRNFLAGVKSQQDALKNSSHAVNSATVLPMQQPNQQPSQGSGIASVQASQQQRSTQQQSGMAAQSPALDAARQQTMRPTSSPQVPGQPSRPSLVPEGSYTHAQAMNAANRSYSSNPQAASQQMAQNSNSAQANTKTQDMVQTKQDPERTDRPAPPITKSFPIQPPTPVTVGPARPTMMAPNNGPPGAIGQPAVTQNPTYNLHGQGDHVLERGKLHELVRQVTGAGDGAVGEHQGLQPEVEESILMLADEFLDNVVTAACKLAKLRGSQTLDLRDIQLVLERQYNIRIPGYGLDEVRTVRKVQPAPAYYQKLNAINAAKVVGKTSDV